MKLLVVMLLELWPDSNIQLEYYSNCSTTEHLDSNGAKLC